MRDEGKSELSEAGTSWEYFKLDVGSHVVQITSFRLQVDLLKRLRTEYTQRIQS